MNDSFDHRILICGHLYFAWTIAYILMLPLFIFVVWAGLRQCRTSRSRSATTHSDVFTYNMAALELCGVVGSCLFASTFYSRSLNVTLAGAATVILAQSGQILFHNLIGLERYLAVLHPITYLRLKKNGVVIRNVSIVGVWTFSISEAFAHRFLNPYVNGFSMLVIVFISLTVITFFCVSVMFALMRPGPGDRGGDRIHIARSKRTALYTMGWIISALLLKFAIIFASYLLFSFQVLSTFSQCLLGVFSQWLNLPSSVVIPGLFLYRQIKQWRRRK